MISLATNRLGSLSFFLISSLVLILPAFFSQNSSHVIALVFLLVLFVSLYILGTKDIFSPYFLYSAFLILLPVSSLYYDSIGLNHNDFLMGYFDLSNKEHLQYLQSKALLYCLFCYISSTFGFFLFVNKDKPGDYSNVKDATFSTKTILPIAFLFSFVGLVNFSYNVFFFSNGSLISYLGNIFARSYEFREMGGTTIGYIFSYMATYMLLYQSYKCNRYKGYYKWLFFISLILSTLMVFSTGRIFSTISYFMVFIIVNYYWNYEIEKSRTNRYIFLALLLLFVGVFIYFFRFASSLSYIGKAEGNLLLVAVDLFELKDLGYFVFEKGNTPNLPLLMFIIEYWDITNKAMLGESFFSFTYAFLPSEIRPIDYQPSAVIKTEWFQHLPGGNLPPTGFGEFFMNFGLYGATLAMFFWGVLCALVTNFFRRSNNYFFLVIYASLSFGFFFQFSKNEFDNLSIWFILPGIFSWSVLKLFSYLLRKQG